VQLAAVDEEGLAQLLQDPLGHGVAGPHAGREALADLDEQAVAGLLRQSGQGGAAAPGNRFLEVAIDPVRALRNLVCLCGGVEPGRRVR
jgi:hypothetical protein